MQVKATTRYAQISAQKLRLPANMVRGKRAVDALDLLRVSNLKASNIVFDTIKSAMANAENNHNLNANTLMLASITVDQGPRLKRARPRSRGMANPINHPMAHITVVLDETSVIEKKVKSVKKPAKATKTSTKEAK